jgi:pyridoxine 5-phosphate synthase
MPMSERLRELTQIKLNLEMAATDEMVGIACRLKPEMAMLVPEGRHEVTTEGGLDIWLRSTTEAGAISRLADAGIVTSVFIDAELAQIEAAARIGASVCEIHTGPYAHAFHAKRAVMPKHRPCSLNSIRFVRPGSCSRSGHAF